MALVFTVFRASGRFARAGPTTRISGALCTGPKGPGPIDRPERAQSAETLDRYGVLAEEAPALPTAARIFPESRGESQTIETRERSTHLGKRLKGA